MVSLCLAGIGLICLLTAFWLLAEIRRQIQRMVQILEEIQKGNGNRRILIPPGHLMAPLAYAVNGVVQRYEEEQLRARRSEEADRQLMTSLSHDIRTPLTTLIGYLDAIHRQVVVGAARKQYLEIARRKAHDLKQITDALFVWCKLHSGEASLDPAVQDVGELTRRVLVDWVPLLEEARIGYEANIREAPFWVVIDKEGYQRILNNLLQNVLVHSQATRILICVQNDGEDVLVQIADNGTGIAEEDLGHIFSRLYKCDSSRASCGSGLGLSIAQQLVEKMGGCIAVKSKSGCGTSFSLRFPAAGEKKCKENPRLRQGSCKVDVLP